jgi:aminotransferase
MHISERTKCVGESKINKSLVALERDPSIISLGAGEPDFPAPKNVITAAKKWLDKGYTHYSSFQGRLELRKAITRKVKKENKIDATEEEVIVTSGSKEAILLAMLSVLDPGDEVVVPDPGYVAYKPIAKMIGAFPVPLQLKEEEGFDISVERLKKLITEKSKLLVLNSPSNPTGTVSKRKTLEEIADVIVEKKLTVLTDEAYEKLVYDDARHVSFASLNGMKEYTITTQTFSKSYAMTGFRVGYAVAPKKIIKEMSEFKICTTICAPTISQLAAIEAFKAEKYVQKMRREYDRRRKMLIRRLGELPNIHCVRPRGAFYAFPNVGGIGMNSEKFTDFLLREAKVIVVPGTEFGDFGENHVRMSYATAYEKIEEAMDRIERAVSKA